MTKGAPFIQTYAVLMFALAASFAVPVADGQQVTENPLQQVVLSRWALRHIQQRHWPDSPAQGAGKFAVGITENTPGNDQ